MLKSAIISVFVMLSLSACGNASLVRRDAAGGRVALQGAYMPAMADARLLIVEHCQGRYEAKAVGDGIEFRCRKALSAVVLEGEAAKVAAAPARAAGGR